MSAKPGVGATESGTPEAARERAVFRVFIRGPIEKVWHEITKTDAAQGCFFNAWLNTPGLRVGAPVAMRTKSGRFTLVVGEVLEYDPPHRYAHTFRFTTNDDPPCRVIYDLKAVAGGTEFTLTVEDMPANTKTARDMTRGGKAIVETLRAIVENGRPAFGTRVMYALMGAMEGMLPGRARSENWPMP